MLPGQDWGRIVVLGFLIGWMAGLPGCSGGDQAPAEPHAGTGVTSKPGSGLQLLESRGVRIIPILGTPAGPGYTQVFAEGSRLGDGDLVALGAVEHLEVLNLNSVPVSDLGLKHLSGFTSLRWLYLERTQITDAGLQALEPLRKLAILDVAETAVGNGGLERIARLGNLAALDLTGTRITDAGLPSLAPLRQLEVLRLSRTAVTDSSLESLKASHSLKSLSLEGCRDVLGRGLRPLASLPDLQVLVLNGAPIDDDGMAAIGELGHLSELYLEQTPVNDAGLAHLRRLVSLRKVYLNGSRCTGQGLKTLTATLGNVMATLEKPEPPAAPAQTARAPAPYERVADVIYGWKHGMAMTMDMLKPGRPANGSAVVWMVSDGFYSRREMITPEIPWMDELLSRGYLVCMVTHGAAPRFNIEEAISDVHRAVRFIRHNARSLGIVPDRIGAAGRSAAGHLALMLGMDDGHGWHFKDEIARGELAIHDPIDDESGRVGAVACFSGPTDFRNFGEPGRAVVDHPVIVTSRFRGPFVPRGFDDRTMTYRDVTDPPRVSEWLVRVSPLTHVSRSSAPVLLFYGEKDENVPPQQARVLADALHAAGVGCELEIKAGAGHGWNFDPGDMVRVADWFDQHLGNQGANRAER